MRKPNFSSGFSLIENLLAIAVVSVVSVGLMGGMIALQKMSTQTHLLTSREKQINDIADNIRVSLETYQINYANQISVTDGSNPDVKDLLDLAKLPLAWDNGVSMTAEECTTCAGRYGFVVQPYQSFPGLYLVTMRMTHKTWTEPYRDYVFVVSVK